MDQIWQMKGERLDLDGQKNQKLYEYKKKKNISPVGTFKWF